MMVQICSECLLLQDDIENIYGMHCLCRAEKFSYCEDELDDYLLDLEGMREIFDHLSKRDQVVVNYYTKEDR